MAVKTKAQTVNELKTEIVLLKQKSLQVEKVLDKLDVTIDSIEKLTHEMGTMIRLHEERITTQMNQDADMNRLIEARRIETEQGFAKIEKKIEEFETKILGQMEANKKKIYKLDLMRGVTAALVSIFVFVAGIAGAGYFQAFFNRIIHP